MALKFKCDCGAELAVPDGNDTSAVLCPSCGKSVGVPSAKELEDGAFGASASEGDQSPSALFRAAIAAFNETDLPDPNSAPPASSTPPEPAATPREGEGEGGSTGGVKADEPAPPAAKPSAPPESATAPEPPPEEEEELKLQPLDFGEQNHPETRLASKFDPGLKNDAADEEEAAPMVDIPVAEEWSAPAASVPDESPPASGPKTVDAMSADAALDAIEHRKLRKALKREGESDAPGSVYEPKDAELHGDVIKFHCRCGKRISAPVKARKSVGKCPKCGARLSLPKPGSVAPPKPAGKKEEKKQGRNDKASKKDARSEQKSANVLSATADAADRLRKKPKKAPGAKKPVDSKATETPPAPAWTARFVAFQLDLLLVAATFFGLAYGLAALSMGTMAWAVASAAAVCAWTLNKIVIVAAMGGSCGMLVAGLRIRGVDDAPVGFGRAAARAALGVLLIPGAPAAFGDAEGRTPADRIAGTIISSTSAD